MATIEVPFPKTNGQPGKVLKWRVTKGTMVSVGRILLLYQCVGAEGTDVAEKKLRATQFGRVTKLHVKEGDTVQPGQVFLSMVGCKHPTVMKDLCAECGADLREEALNKDGKKEPITEASVPMLHSIPELKVCPELAEKIGKEDEQRLLQDKKLALLVDLDQTIVHTTNDNVPANMTDVFHYQLYGQNSPWYHTRLRPGTRNFLSEMSRIYELHICTFGARNYAHTVAALLDKKGALFSHRILSRDECFDPASKTANLRALFPCGDDMVCIIDDREDVWQGCGNLVQVKPYHFFRHTGDIHAPPGLEKRDEPDSLLPVADGNKDEPESKETMEKENGTMGDENVEKNDVGRAEVNETREEIADEKVTKDEEKDEENANDESTKIVGKFEENSEMTEESRGKSEEETKSSDSVKVENKESTNAQKESKIGDTAKESERKASATSTATNDVAKESEPIGHEDQDDYLLYLEDILRRIHAEFYECIEKEKGRTSLREIIPRVRARVLKGLHLTFSGLIPTHQKLHQSRAYKVAKAFGAEVTQDLTDKTTHLVAIKPGTAKANIAKKNKNMKIVNPDWLWTSAERWERVDERLFPLTAKARASRIPPPHCSSPDRIEEEQMQRRDSFADTINPLMSFTAEEIENMDKEVEEDMSDQEMDSSALDSGEFSSKRMHDESSDSDSDPDPSTKKRRKLQNESSSDNSSDEKDKYCNDDEDADDDDDLVARFRRGEDLPDDLDLGDNSQDSIGDAPENDDDREWNALGAALEREFLSE